MDLEVFSSESRRHGELVANPLIAAIKSRSDINGIMEKVNERYIKKTDCFDNSCLHYAVKMYQNDLSVIELLLKYGASINVQNNKGDTPLHFAVRNENCNGDLVRILLDNNGDPNIENCQQETPLHIIIKKIRYQPSKSADVVKLLLDRGADPNIPNFKGITPMAAAFGSKPFEKCLNFNSISELIEHGADMSYRFCGRSVLYFAMYQLVDPSIVEKILRCNLDFRNIRYDLCRALHLAVRFNFPVDVIKQLLYHGSDINEKHEEWGTPLHSAAFLANVPIIDTLINNGSDINSRNKYGSTPLIKAVISVPKPLKLQAIEMLLDKGADVNVKNHRNKTAIYYASESYSKGGTIDIIKLLLEHGADPNGITNLRIHGFDCRGQLFHKFVIPFLVLWNFLDESDIMRPQRVINFSWCHSYDKNICKILLRLSHSCMSELIKMKKDTINGQYSLYQYVYDNITKSEASIDYPFEMVGEILTRENKYTNCKDLLMASLKKKNLIGYLPDLRIYTIQEKNIFLHYSIVTCIDIRRFHNS